jgi:hypothetical protein
MVRPYRERTDRAGVDPYHHPGAILHRDSDVVWIGLIWALIRGWQLTVAAMDSRLHPAFAVTMVEQLWSQNVRLRNLIQFYSDNFFL